MVNIKFYNAKENSVIVKATTHKSGKIGFSTGAKNLMKLEANRYFKVGVNSDDSSDKSLYLQPVQKDEEGAFTVNKAGSYYYLRVKQILDDMKVKYEESGIIYNIKEIEIEQDKYYVLTPRPNKEKK